MSFLPDSVLRHLEEMTSAPDVAVNELDEATAGADPLMQTIARRFRVSEPIAEGGMGAVYRAHDRETGAEVAIKISHAGAGEHADMRFEREASVLASMSADGIVGHVAHGSTSHGTKYLAMELLEGETFAERLDGGPVSLDEALAIGTALANALAVVHEQGIVHRDVKPENVLICTDGRVKLVDFGLARGVAERDLTTTGHVVGTLGYMAPEQARGGRDVDARADLFALGCLLYEALALRPPYVVLRPERAYAAVMYGTVAPLEAEGVPDAVSFFVDDLMAKDPDRRPKSARAVAARLSELRAHGGGEPPPSSAWTFRGRDVPLVSRAGELAWLTSHLAARGALIVAPAGTGKTRLAAEAIASTRESWIVAAADPADRGAPFSFLAKLVRALAGVGSGDREGEARARVIATFGSIAGAAAARAIADALRPPATAAPAIAAALSAFVASMPLLSIFIDDADAADAASLDAIASLASLPPDRRPRLLVAARPAPADPVRALARSFSLPLLPLRGLTSVELLAASRALLGRDATAGERVGAAFHSGSFLHLEESMRAAIEGRVAPPSDTLEARVDARIASLDPYASWTMRAASTLGSFVRFDDLLRLLGQRDPYGLRRAIATLAAAEIFVREPGGVRFRHRVHRERARAAMSA